MFYFFSYLTINIERIWNEEFPKHETLTSITPVQILSNSSLQHVTPSCKMSRFVTYFERDPWT